MPVFLYPAGRHDAINLERWLDTMMKDMQNMHLESNREYFDYCQFIYGACLKEIMKQVKVNCRERGELLDKVWNEYLSLFETIFHEQNKKVK